MTTTYRDKRILTSRSGSQPINQFVSGLKSKNEDTRAKASRDLYHYVTTELREVPMEELTAFMDEFNHYIFDMVSSPDNNERKGAILAIESLIGVDVGNTSTRISRFANYLRNTFPSSDIEVMELAAKAVGKLALVSGTYSTEYIDVEVKRAFEWLGGDRHEGKRLAAVLVLKELAETTPTFFFQQVNQFFEVIFNAVRDPKANIREAAVRCLRYALIVTAQREKTTQTQYYNLCFENAKNGFTDVSSGSKQDKIDKITREDKIHGSLIVLNELLRISNAEWEKTYSTVLFKVSASTLCTSGKESRDFISWRPRKQREKRNFPKFQISSVGETFSESNSCRTLVRENFAEICKLVLDQRSSKNVHIQSALFNILPRLAAFNDVEFAGSAMSPGSTNRAAEIDKKNLYSNLSSDNYLFFPVAFTTLGSCGEDAKTIINWIGDLVVAKTGDPRSKYYLWERMSIDIQKYNAASILGILHQSISNPDKDASDYSQSQF